MEVRGRKALEELALCVLAVAAASIVQAEKLFAPQAEGMVCAGGFGFGGVDVNCLLHASKIASPESTVVAMDGEVEAGIAEFVPC